MAACAKCNRQEPDIALKTCAKCSGIKYCSRECQVADWANHKAVCRQGSHNAGSSSSTAQSCLEKPFENPFERLASHTWLHERPEKDVYRLLIDAYRLRMDDKNKAQDFSDATSVYNGATDGEKGFRCFLNLVESRSGFLPPWWNTEKANACLKLGMDGNQWHCLQAKTSLRGITIRYGDGSMAMQLRMFSEDVYRGDGEESTIDFASLVASYA